MSERKKAKKDAKEHSSQEKEAPTSEARPQMEQGESSSSMEHRSPLQVLYPNPGSRNKDSNTNVDQGKATQASPNV